MKSGRINAATVTDAGVERILAEARARFPPIPEARGRQRRGRGAKNGGEGKRERRGTKVVERKGEGKGRGRVKSKSKAGGGREESPMGAASPTREQKGFGWGEDDEEMLLSGAELVRRAVKVVGSSIELDRALLGIERSGARLA